MAFEHNNNSPAQALENHQQVPLSTDICYVDVMSVDAADNENNNNGNSPDYDSDSSMPESVSDAGYGSHNADSEDEEERLLLPEECIPHKLPFFFFHDQIPLPDDQRSLYVALQLFYNNIQSSFCPPFDESLTYNVGGKKEAIGLVTAFFAYTPPVMVASHMLLLGKMYERIGGGGRAREQGWVFDHSAEKLSWKHICALANIVYHGLEAGVGKNELNTGGWFRRRAIVELPPAEIIGTHTPIYSIGLFVKATLTDTFSLLAIEDFLGIKLDKTIFQDTPCVPDFGLALERDIVCVLTGKHSSPDPRHCGPITTHIIPPHCANATAHPNSLGHRFWLFLKLWLGPGSASAVYAAAGGATTNTNNNSLHNLLSLAEPVRTLFMRGDIHIDPIHPLEATTRFGDKTGTPEEEAAFRADTERPAALAVRVMPAWTVYSALSDVVTTHPEPRKDVSHLYSRPGKIERPRPLKGAEVYIFTDNHVTHPLPDRQLLEIASCVARMRKVKREHEWFMDRSLRKYVAR
ncbi:hypothetical protein DFH27DRAFT_608593 [Peziza echinospora]|nr:hypothetical protein DFH27DRAFT_608593 [Peziza echinospora]